MTLSVQLDPAVRELALAIGLLTRSPSGSLSLDADFFRAPWSSVAGILADPAQRAALVSALELLVDQFEPELIGMLDAPVAGIGRVRNVFALLGPDAPGQVMIVLTRSGQAPGAPLELAIAAEARAAGGGPGVMAELVLLTAQGSTLTPVAGTPDYPLSITVTAPLGTNGQAIAASLAILAPPHHGQSRFTIRLDRPGSDPLIVDLSQSRAPVGQMAVLLLDLALGQVSGLTDAQQRLRDALSGLAGLPDTMPEFPFGRLFDDPHAFRDWLAALAAQRLPDGSSALAGWLNALAGLIDVPVQFGNGVAGDPIVLMLAPGAAGQPAILLEFAVTADPVNAGPLLEIGLSVTYAGDPSVDAQLVGHATLVAIPLTGHGTVRVLDRFKLLIAATASGDPLVPLSGAGPSRFGVGKLLAGISLVMLGDAPKVTPVLQLVDVTIGLAGGESHFDLIDFTQYTSVASAAGTVLENEIDAGLGADSALVLDALRVLLGVATTPGTDFAQAATGPAAAVAAYYRALLGGPAGWSVIASAIGHLLGNAQTTTATGSGTAMDPWSVPLEALTVPPGSAVTLRLECWNSGSATAPEFLLAMRIGTSDADWDAALRIGLIAIPLDPAAGTAARGLPLAELVLQASPTAPSAPAGGVTVGADAVRVTLRWQPGQPLAAEAIVSGIMVESAGFPHDLGTLDLAALTLPDLALPDLGLGLDPQAIWPALRVLVAQCAACLAGDGAATLLAALGITDGNLPGDAARVPSLELPAGTSLADALRDPLGVLRTWVAGLLRESEASVIAGAGPAALAALRLLRAVAIDHFDASTIQAVPGGGSALDPWRIALAGPDADAALTVWLGPDGPPKAWAAAALQNLSDPLLDGAGLIACAEALRGHIGRLGPVLATRDPGDMATAIDQLDAFLADSDGIVPLAAATPTGGAWELGQTIDCAHPDAPMHPAAVAQVAARIAALTAGLASDAWSVVLLAPAFAGPQCWDTLVTANGHTPADIAALSLRAPGIPPHLADLGIVPSARWYRADIGDDGITPLADNVAAAGRVIAGIRQARPGAKVIIVSHSYLGLVAEAYANGAPQDVLGLIALAAPLGPVATASVAVPDLAEAVRIMQGLAPPAATETAVRALGWLGQVLDDYPGGKTAPRVPGIAQSLRWVRQGMPPALTGISALAIPARLARRPIAALATSIAAETAALTRAAPASLHFGVEIALPVPDAPAGDIQTEIKLALELGSIALATGSVAANPGHIAVITRIWRDGGWLLGAPALSANATGRLRALTLRLDVAASAAGPVTTLTGRLDDAGLQGDHVVACDLDHPCSAQLLGQTIAAMGRAAASPAAQALLAMLADLGLVRLGTSTAPAIVLADALASARADAAAWFAARAPALLDGAEGLLGFVRDPAALIGGGPWRMALPGLPLECRIDKGPWRLSVAVTADGLRLGDAVDITAAATVALTDLATVAEWSAALAGVRLTQTGAGGLAVESDWLDQPLILSSADPEAIAAALARALTRFIAAASIRAVADEVLGTPLTLPSLLGLFANPGRWLAAQVNDPVTALPDHDRVIDWIAQAAHGLGLESDATHAVRIPGLLGLSVAMQGETLRLALATLAPVIVWQDGGNDAALTLQLGAGIGAGGVVDPVGAVSLRLHLPANSGWSGIDIALQANAGDVSLGVTSDSGLALTLLPTFGGLDSLIGAGAQMLLPIALDRLAQALASSAAHQAALDVAAAMDLYDAAATAGQGFQARAAGLAALVDGLGNGDLQTFAPAVAGALAPLLQAVLGTGVAISASNGEVTLAIANVLGGTLSMHTDWTATPPGLRLSAAGFDLDPLTLDAEIGLVAGDLKFDVTAGVAITAVPGVVLEPVLAVALNTAGASGSAGPLLEVGFAPAGPSGTVFQLAPVPTLPTEQQLQDLLKDWLLPLAGNVVLHVAEPLLARPIWSGGKTVGDLAVATALVTRTAPGAPIIVANQIPKPVEVLNGALTFLTGIPVPLTGDLALSIVSSNNIFGIGLTGSQRFEMDPFALSLQMGLPQGTDLGWGDRGKAVGLLLLDLSNAADPRFSPVVRLGGLGVSLGRLKADEPLIKAGGFTLGAAGGYLSLDIGLSGAGAPRLQGAVFGAVEVRGLSLVIDTGGDGGNPVAASLIQSDDSGDPAPAVPGFDMLVGKGPNGFDVSFSGQPKIKIEINRTFGPLHIKEMALLYNELPGRPGEVGITLDAAVALAGIGIAADDLGVYIPLDRPTDLSQWKIELAGLAVDYTGSGFSIAGGLQKAELAGGVIEYRGALSVNVAAYGFSAIGAYAQPSDAAGRYTSLFMFLAVSAPIGGPPYLFVTGLAAGAGYNRRLLTPRDPAGVPGFPLVQAMEGGAGDGGAMAQLERIGADIPPARGALWVAAGIKFSTFELLKTTALLTVAVDRGFEVTLMGLMRLQLPPVAEAAIVSLELALAAKYSTVDQVLSIRAELTDNSWLISRDCKLTGGFAFVVWFGKPEALLTVGGYSRRFTPPAHYPVVPRVGFNWSVGGGIVIKGGAFFALTHSAVMVGGSLEATYSVGPVRAWFIAELDVIVSWDPFRYQASAFVQVGVEIKLRACLFGKCVSLPPLRLTIGATLELEGPPLSGYVEVDAGIATVRIPFGTKKPQTFLTWEELRRKYVGVGTATSISTGALAGDGQADGSAAKPWLVASEFRFRVETKMPATNLLVNGGPMSAGNAPARVDLVPAGAAHGPVRNTLKITIARASGSGWKALTPTEIGRLAIKPISGKFAGAVWDGLAGSTDAKGNRVANTSRPMMTALAMAQFTSAPEIAEATGALGDMRIAGMVEESPMRTMAFRGRAADMGPPPQPAAPPAPIFGTIMVAPILRLAAAEPVQSLELATTFSPLLSSTVRARSVTLATTHTAPEAFAAASIWTLAPAASHTVKLSGSPTRVIALSATGKILADSSADDEIALGAGIQSLVMAPTAAAAAASTGALGGWEAGDDLVQAGPATFIAPGAVLTTPEPWSPRRSAKRLVRGSTAFAASRLTRAVDGIVTRIAIDRTATPGTIVVRLDRSTEGSADATDVGIVVTGASIKSRRTVEREHGVELAIAITPDAGAEAFEVRVVTGPDWRLAGVVAMSAQVGSVASRLRRNDVLRLSSAPLAASAARLVTLPVLEIV